VAALAKKNQYSKKKKTLMDAIESMGTPTNCHQHRKEGVVARV
jgi:hypothetical protein